jgi:hypothetical protein
MGFDIRRTPTDRDFVAIVTTADILVTATHFFGGRTIPCESPDCQACNQAVPFRVHVYVSAFVEKSHEHVIFECTANAAKAFQEYKEAQGTLRGCLFRASRPKCTKNGKVVIITRPANLVQLQLPEAPNLVLALSVIWRLPTAALREEGLLRGSPGLTVSSAVSSAVHEQPDNAGGDLKFGGVTTAVATEALLAKPKSNGKPKRFVV